MAATVRGVHDDSLCHGTFGSVEALLTTAEHTGDAELSRIARTRRQASPVAFSPAGW